MIVREYDTAVYDFPARTGKLLRVPELRDLHRAYQPPKDPRSDQDTPAHAVFYDGFGEIEPLYHEFLRRNLLPLFDADICFQRVPTFRVAFPAGTAVSSFHRDSEYNHQAGTVNYWLPLTDAFGTNSIWLESGPGLEDYSPAEMKPGQVLEFDAVALRHGNHPNGTGQTRVSFDMRVIPLDLFQDSGLHTVAAGVRLGVGGYFRTMSRDGAVSN